MAAKKSGKKGASAPIGRPTKYRPEFCQDIINHMTEGYSIESFPAVIYNQYKIAVSKQSIYEWEEVHQDFSDAIKAGRALSQMHYEKVARSGMAGNLQRVARETPVIGNDGRVVIGPDGKVVTKKEYEPASFNASSWIFTMKNRFQWTDRLEHSGQIKGSNPIGDTLAEILKDPKLANAAKEIAERLVEDDE